MVKTAARKKGILSPAPSPSMSAQLVHIVADHPRQIDIVRRMLPEHYALTSSLIAQGKAGIGTPDKILVIANLRNVDTIAALKDMESVLAGAQKRIFVVDARAHLNAAQAYAIGATTVIRAPLSERRLLASLDEGDALKLVLPAGETSAQTGSRHGAIALQVMFDDVCAGRPINALTAKKAAILVSESIQESGLTDWVSTVRQHHEGTYQHCLLVLGVVVDFGVSLGVSKIDLERLCTAAMFHDIGKAKVPLTVLDKPGRLDDRERKLIESHPVIGHAMLKSNPDISSEVLDAVRHHHEYLDGSGYPDGLMGSEITDIVRMLTISDIFAALIEDRRYKPPMARGDAYDVICGMRGKLEWPLVKAFRDVALHR